MWTSVPQMALLWTRISTSLGPTSGMGTSPIQMPSSRLVFSSAFIGNLQPDHFITKGNPRQSGGAGLDDS